MKGKMFTNEKCHRKKYEITFFQILSILFKPGLPLTPRALESRLAVAHLILGECQRVALSSVLALVLL